MKKKAEAKAATHLTGWDVLALERAETEASSATQMIAQLELEKRANVAQQSSLQLQVRLAQIDIEKKLEAQKTRLANAKASAGKLAADVAERNRFSWSTHSYNPDTGELVALES